MNISFKILHNILFPFALDKHGVFMEKKKEISSH